MFTNWNQFITWEKSTIDTIDVKTIYIDIAEDSWLEFCYLRLFTGIFQVKKENQNLKLNRKTKKGKIHFWIAKPREEWYEEIRFTKDNLIQLLKN